MTTTTDETIDKAFKEYSKNIVDRIVKDASNRKRVVVLNFTNDNLDTNTNERLLGIYLARLFTSFLSEAGNRCGVSVINREIGEKVTLLERKYRKPFPTATESESLFAMLAQFEADYYISSTYRLSENELEIIELVALTSKGGKELYRVKGKIMIPIEDYQKLKEMEDVIVPWQQIDPKLLTFLIQNGNWHNPINIEVRDFYTKERIESELYLNQYIKLIIDLDSVPAYLYVIGWDQELKRLSFLYPNEYDKTNPVIRRRITIPSSDKEALPIQGPLKNKEIGDYNWIKVFVSKEPIKSFPVIDGFIPETDARLKNISDELDGLGLENWSSKMIDFWVKER